MESLNRDIINKLFYDLSIEDLTQMRASSSENHKIIDQIINEKHLKRFGKKYSSRSIALKMLDLKFVTYRELLHIIAESDPNLTPLNPKKFIYPEDEKSILIGNDGEGSAELDDIYNDSYATLYIYVNDNFVGSFICTDYYNPKPIIRYSNIINNLTKSLGFKNFDRELSLIYGGQVDQEGWNISLLYPDGYSTDETHFTLLHVWDPTITKLQIDINNEEFLQADGSLAPIRHEFIIKNYIDIHKTLTIRHN
jgi:hypothetical protein